MDVQTLNTIFIAAATALLTTVGAILLARQRMQREFRLQYRAEAVAKKVLSHPIWPWRSFRMIKHHLGGFNDEELRKLLVQAGAVRFETKEGEEVWGLYDRMSHLLEKPRYPILDKVFTVVDEVEVSPELSARVKELHANEKIKAAVSLIREETGLSHTEAHTLLNRLTDV